MMPSKIGPWEINRKIGSGGMGTVYHGTHDESKEEAAVKILPASLAREAGFVERFSREVEALQRLKNRHIVELIDFGVEDEIYYYSMDYVDGVTLTQRIREQKRIEWPTVINYSIQICSALKAAHDAGIIHRDLKPSNLLIDHDDNLKLTDFGVAQVFAATKLTKTGGIIGTAEYMSPEQAQGKRVTKKSDVYSLGAVMYVMLTGRPPFTGRSAQEVIHKHLTALFDRPQLVVPEIPHWLDQTICQCLEKNPEKRFPDAFVLSKQLMEIERKIDLSREKVTLSEDETRTAETVVLNDSSSGNLDAIGGTFVRDVVKAQIEQSQQKHPVLRFFDNTFVLLALLIAVIVGSYYWWQSSYLTPEEMLERGTALFNQGPGKWNEARDQYLLPLLEKDEDKWGEKVNPMLNRIGESELSKPFGKQPPWSSKTEPQRLLDTALDLYKDGDVQRAQQMLSALIAVTTNHPEHATIHSAAITGLSHIQSNEMKRKSIRPFVTETLQQAEQLIAEKKPNEAADVLKNLILLYDGHIEVATQVQTAKELLQQASSHTMTQPDTSENDIP